jgi:hypothetical protein
LARFLTICQNPWISDILPKSKSRLPFRKPRLPQRFSKNAEVIFGRMTKKKTHYLFGAECQKKRRPLNSVVCHKLHLLKYYLYYKCATGCTMADATSAFYVIREIKFSTHVRPDLGITNLCLGTLEPTLTNCVQKTLSRTLACGYCFLTCMHVRLSRSQALLCCS